MFRLWFLCRVTRVQQARAWRGRAMAKERISPQRLKAAKCSQSLMVSIKIAVLTRCGGAIQCQQVPPREGGTFHFRHHQRAAP
jgi:hypothetical protein